MRRILLAVFAGALMTATAAFAHHSYAATYDVTHEIKCHIPPIKDVCDMRL